MVSYGILAFRTEVCLLGLVVSGVTMKPQSASTKDSASKALERNSGPSN